MKLETPTVFGKSSLLAGYLPRRECARDNCQILRVQITTIENIEKTITGISGCALCGWCRDPGSRFDTQLEALDSKASSWE